MKKERIKKISKYESALQYRLNSAAIRQEEPSDIVALSEAYYKAGDMTKKEASRHLWVMDTMMFQRIAMDNSITMQPEDSYEELSEYYDFCFGKKSAKDQQVIADNAKTNLIILKAAGEAGKNRNG